MGRGGWVGVVTMAVCTKLQLRKVKTKATGIRKNGGVFL